MKSVLAILLASVMAGMVGCGGGGGGSAEKWLSITLPDSLISLSSEISAEGELVPQQTSEANKSQGTNAFLGTIKEGSIIFALGEVAEGAYTFKLSVFYLPTDRAGRVAIAHQDYTIEVEGDWDVKIVDTPADFSYDIDSDGDTLFNLNEIAAKLDPSMADTDGDSFIDSLDDLPLTYQDDTDKDGVPDERDDDIDGDGLTNFEEEGIGTNKSSADTDGDGVSDKYDNCPLVSNTDQTDSDADAKGDQCVPDDDADGLPDGDEINIHRTNPKITDTDGDTLTDPIEIYTLKTNPLSIDTDGDSVSDDLDNCPIHSNTAQQDMDGDKKGDACDNDIDGDNWQNGPDNCPTVFNPDQTNTDKEYKDDKNKAPDDKDITADGLGDVCDDDIDGDGLPIIYVDQGKYEDKDKGNDNYIGTYLKPVATIKRAISLAVARGDGIAVAAGRYDLAGVVFPPSIILSGGYKSDPDSPKSFASLIDRKVHETNVLHKTTLINVGAAQTLVLKGITGRVEISGFFIENKSTSSACPPLFTGSDPVEAVHVEDTAQEGYVVLHQNNIEFDGSGNTCTKGVAIYGPGNVELNGNFVSGGSGSSEGVGIFVRDNNAIIKNNIVSSTGSPHAIGVKVISANPIIVNNTIEAGKIKAGVPVGDMARGIVFESEGGVIDTISPKIVNNAVFTRTELDKEQDVLHCESILFKGAKLLSNILVTFPNPPYGSRALISGCGVAGGVSYMPPNDTLDGTKIVSVIVGVSASGNQSYAKLPADQTIDDPGTLITAFINLTTYILKDIGPNQGIDTKVVEYGAVVDDYYGSPRPVGTNHDIGALETK